MARKNVGSRFPGKTRLISDAALLVALIAVVAFVVAVIVQKLPAAPSQDAVGPTSSTASPVAPTPSTPAPVIPVAAFIGDSYTTGSGGESTRWTTIVAKAQGWREVNVGQRGTGYVQTAEGQDCPAFGCPNYLQSIAAAVAAQPDIVVVSGGRNDLNRRDGLAGNIRKVFEQLRAQLPKARIIAISPFWGSGDYPLFRREISTEVRTSVESVKGRYLDVGQVLADKPSLVDSEGNYPTADGYRAIASAVQTSLKQPTPK